MNLSISLHFHPRRCECGDGDRARAPPPTPVLVQRARSFGQVLARLTEVVGGDRVRQEKTLHAGVPAVNAQSNPSCRGVLDRSLQRDDARLIQYR